MVIVDSGFWIALINRRDDYHVLAQEVLEKNIDTDVLIDFLRGRSQAVTYLENLIEESI
ncbi:MAG: hypothetical protein ACRCU2_19800 [Planktothrix sp.]